MRSFFGDIFIYKYICEKPSRVVPVAVSHGDPPESLCSVAPVEAESLLEALPDALGDLALQSSGLGTYAYICFH